MKTDEDMQSVVKDNVFEPTLISKIGSKLLKQFTKTKEEMDVLKMDQKVSVTFHKSAIFTKMHKNYFETM